MKIEFKKIEKENIFNDFFKSMDKNNILDFANKTVILYGPNGTGKTSLSKIFNYEEKTKFELEEDGIVYTTENTKENRYFYVIKDQNARNIIKGNEEEFLIGENIKREFELKNIIEDKEKQLKSSCTTILREIFGIKKVTNKFLKDLLIFDRDLQPYVRELSKTGETKIDTQKFINYLLNEIEILPIEYNLDHEEYQYYKKNYEDTVLEKIEKLNLSEIKKEEKIKELEETKMATQILKKYQKEECIVCDNHINHEELLSKKSETVTVIMDSLSETTKKILTEILDEVEENDIFQIKSIIEYTLGTGDKQKIENLQNKLDKFKGICFEELKMILREKCSVINILEEYKEYNALINQTPEIDDEDLLLVKELISENLEKELVIERDEKNKSKLKLKLGHQEILEKDRDSLHLSAGEQNFISLCFEILKAQKCKEKIVVIDDPISSFDSIYKNKVVFLIKKMLDKKLNILLTHNLDLVRLMNFQMKNAFKLYIINNTDDEENGFIDIKDEEKEILLNIHTFLNVLRESIFDEIEDEKVFLCSLIPFMRGYCQLIGEKTLKNKLTDIMHGYKNIKVDISNIYRNLFLEGHNHSKISQEYILDIGDLLNIELDNLKILKGETKYPLLDRTLKHSFTYLYLRATVERELVNLYSLNTNKVENVSQIIDAAFPRNNSSKLKDRVFFLSRKTLLNEFNHFEGNINIFQPAIDISDKSLEKEKNDILKRLESLR